MDPNIEDTIAQSVLGQLRRAGVQIGTGLTGYDLQPGAKILAPLMQEAIPLRNRIARVKGAGGTATNFKAITAINSARLTPGVGEGHRNAANTTAVATRSIPYASLGHDDLVTWDAEDAAKGFADLPETTKMTLLWSLMLSEEATMLAGAGSAIGTQTGSISSALGQAVLGTPTTATTGGSLAATTSYTIYCMALTYQGVYLAGSYFDQNNGDNPASYTIATPFSRSNMGGTSDTIAGGAGQISASGSITTGGTSTNTITASVTAIAAAFGYAWFIGTSAGTARLCAITALPTYTFKSTNATGQLASVFTGLAADNSVNVLEYTGLVPYIAGSPLSFKKNLAGAALTSDGARGIAEFNALFNQLWLAYKTSYTDIWCSAAQAVKIDKLVSQNSSGQNNFMAVIDGTKGESASFIPAGPARVIVNPIANKNVRLNVHPSLPDTMILFTMDKVPFAANGIANAWEYHYQRDYFGQDWPRNNRQYEYGAYTRGALALNAEMLFGMIYAAA